VHISLVIPNVAVKPNLDEVQEALTNAGRNISSVARGVGQWTGGKLQQVRTNLEQHHRSPNLICSFGTHKYTNQTSTLLVKTKHSLHSLLQTAHYTFFTQYSTNLRTIIEFFLNIQILLLYNL